MRERKERGVWRKSGENGEREENRGGMERAENAGKRKKTGKAESGAVRTGMGWREWRGVRE